MDFFWVKPGGEYLNIKLLPWVLNQLRRNENVLIITESNWENIFITLKHLSKGAVKV
jgi:hypothetical protein